MGRQGDRSFILRPAPRFPDMQGLSPRNLHFMRSFAAAYPDAEIVKQLVSHLPWGHIIHLLQRVKDPDARSWYARASIAQGWSRSILDLQIQSQAHQRQGKAVNNFTITLPPADSDMAIAKFFKDPYLFDFIGTADPRREAEVEQALVDHIQKFLLEMGAGFAFVGRRVHLEFSSADYYLDLLFYHLKLRCFVVVELKAVPFQPEFTANSICICPRWTTCCAIRTTSRPLVCCSAKERTASSPNTP